MRNGCGGSLADLRQCKPYKDFGRGFYCTTIFAQTAAMAKRVVRIYGGTPVVTEYDFDKPDQHRFLALGIAGYYRIIRA